MIKLGIAGIGRIALDYIGLICAGMVPEAEIAALCSRDAGHMMQVQAQYPALHGLPCFSSYDEMLSSGTIDAVLICTPHGLHPAMTERAVEAGIHVLVEKPAGIFGDEVARALERLKKSPEIVCGVLYNRRASPAYRYIKGVLERGELGGLVRSTWLMTDLYRTNAYYQSGSWRGSWHGEGGGLLMTQASHQLDLIQWLCGMPSSVWARCSSVGRLIMTENEAELFLTYPNGGHGQFIASAHECPGTNLLEICGTRGRIRIQDDSEVEIVKLSCDEREFAAECPSPFEKAPCSREELSFDGKDNKIQQASTIQNFARAILGQEPIQCTLEEGLKSLQIIHGAYLSHWKGMEVELPVDEQEFRAFLTRADSN